jgi:hypothetical protein
MRELDPQAAEAQVSDWRTFYGCLLAALVFGCLLGMLLPSLNISPWVAMALWLFAVGLAAFFLRMIFPKVVLVDRPVRVEVPVERIVEKRVESIVVKYVSSDVLAKDGKPYYILPDDVEAMWKQIKVGMTRREVMSILGRPDGEPSNYAFQQLAYHWGKGSIHFELERRTQDYRVTHIFIPHY